MRPKHVTYSLFIFLLGLPPLNSSDALGPTRVLMCYLYLNRCDTRTHPSWPAVLSATARDYPPFWAASPNRETIRISAARKLVNGLKCLFVQRPWLCIRPKHRVCLCLYVFIRKFPFFKKKKINLIPFLLEFSSATESFETFSRLVKYLEKNHDILLWQRFQEVLAGILDEDEISFTFGRKIFFQKENRTRLKRALIDGKLDTIKSHSTWRSPARPRFLRWRPTAAE